MGSGTIIYFGGFEMPDCNAAAHRVLANAKILKKSGFEIVFCGVKKDKKNCNTVTKDGAFYYCPSYYPKGLFGWMKYLFNIGNVKKALQSFNDVKAIICYNSHSFHLKKMLRICKKKKIKIVADITEWYQNKFSLLPLKFIKWLDTKQVMEKYHKKMDGIISISSFLSTYYGTSVKNVVTVPPLIDINEPIWHQNAKTNKDIIEFVYSGDPCTDKDKVDVVINCLTKINSKDFVFNIYGMSRDHFLRLSANSKKQLQLLSDKVVFHGRVSHAESVLSLLCSDYCVFFREPTRKNNAGFPTKFVECVTTGIGIITNAFSDIEAFKSEPNTIVLPEISEESIVRAFDLCIKKGKLKHSLNTSFHYLLFEKKLTLFLKEVLQTY